MKPTDEARAIYKPRYIYQRLPRPLYRDAFEELWFKCSLWDDNQRMFGDSLDTVDGRIISEDMPPEFQIPCPDCGTAPGYVCPPTDTRYHLARMIQALTGLPSVS
jgi:hypothetical protein